jgi:hypothetical protein
MNGMSIFPASAASVPITACTNNGRNDIVPINAIIEKSPCIVAMATTRLRKRSSGSRGSGCLFSIRMKIANNRRQTDIPPKSAASGYSAPRSTINSRMKRAAERTSVPA